MDGPIRRFIEDVQSILADDVRPSATGLSRLAERMRALVTHPEVLASHQEFVDAAVSGKAGTPLYTDTGRRSQVLYTDNTGLTLVRSRFDPDEPTPIHSHGTWGIVGVYAGRDRHQAWRRLDKGTAGGKAQVELTEERVLGPGDVVIIPYPPQDIHAQQGFGGEPAYELVLFGLNAMVIPRLIFDPEKQTAREVVPGRN